MVLMTVMLFSVSVSAIGMLKNDSINKVKQAGEISTDSMMLLNEKYILTMKMAKEEAILEKPYT